MNHVRGFAFLLACIAIAGCEAPAPGNTDTEGQTKIDVTDRVSATIDQFKTDAQQRAEAEMEKVLADVQTQIDALGRKAAQAGEEARDRVWETMRIELEKKQALAEAQLSKFRKNSGEAGKELAQGLAKAVDDLREAMIRAGAALQQDAEKSSRPAEAPVGADTAPPR